MKIILCYCHEMRPRTSVKTSRVVDLKSWGYHVSRFVSLQRLIRSIPANLFESYPCTGLQFSPVHWPKSLYTLKIFFLARSARSSRKSIDTYTKSITLTKLHLYAEYMATYTIILFIL